MKIDYDSIHIVYELVKHHLNVSHNAQIYALKFENSLVVPLTIILVIQLKKLLFALCIHLAVP